MQVRLAERRGILTGPALSPVQTASLELLIVLDEAERARAASANLKLAIVGHDPSTLRALFPEVVGEAERTLERYTPVEVGSGAPGAVQEAQGAPEILSEADLDDDAIELIFDEPPDFDEAIELLGRANREVAMQVTPDHLRGQWR